MDYHKWNTMMVQDTYALPRIDECIDSLGEAQGFTTFDVYSGYWKMCCRKQYRHKTAFACHAGTFTHTGMPFGLNDAPAYFQRALYITPTMYKLQRCPVYLGDVINFSKSLNHHIICVNEIQLTLANAGLSR